MKSYSSVSAARHRRRFGFPSPGKAALAACLTAALALPFNLRAREKDAIQYGAGLIINVPFPENEVTQVVQDVAQNGIIRGTREYNKDEYISGATPSTSTRVFKEWTEGGKVFYKVRLKALDPLNFKNGNDVGTLAVRYIVQPQGDKNSILRIDAVFVEDFRHVTHPSNGSVESAEYKDIHDRLDAIDSMKAQTVELEKEKQARVAARLADKDKSTSAALVDESSSSSSSSSSVSHVSQPDPAPVQPEEAPAIADAPTSARPQTLEERVAELRRLVERLVKAPGAPLRSAPFHTASTLQSLPAGSEVLIVITTPYWVGVETRDGQHGWILRDQLELLP
jgi:hypothetical protein